MAKTTGTFYGVSMTAGDLYTIAYVGLSGAPSTAIDMGDVAAVANGMSVDPNGNIVVGDGDGAYFVNVQTSGSLSLYGLTIPHHSAKVVAGNAQGGTDCSAGAASAAANSLYFQSAAPFVDSSDNIYLNDNEAGGVNGGGCDWVLPAQSGTFDNMSVTAGNVYKLAGNGGTSATPDGTAGIDANVSGTSEMTLDPRRQRRARRRERLGLRHQPRHPDPGSEHLRILVRLRPEQHHRRRHLHDRRWPLQRAGDPERSDVGPFGRHGEPVLHRRCDLECQSRRADGRPDTGTTDGHLGHPEQRAGHGGNAVAVTGTGFVSGSTTVDFGSNAGTSVDVTSPTSLTVDVPAGTGTVPVSVITTGGGGLDPRWPVPTPTTRRPTVTSVSPTSGHRAALIQSRVGRHRVVSGHHGPLRRQRGTWVVVDRPGTPSPCEVPAGMASSRSRVATTLVGSRPTWPAPTPITARSCPEVGLLSAKSTALIGNYPEKVSGRGWRGEATVTLNECASTAYSLSTCDAANRVMRDAGHWPCGWIFKNDH